jgi:hypothetical protein
VWGIASGHYQEALMRKNALLVVVAVLTAVALSVAPAWAGALVEFTGLGGSITSRDDGSLFGALPISFLYVEGAPLHNGFKDVSNGVFSFDTGTLGTSSFIAVTGGIPSLGLAPQQLLYGTISDWIGTPTDIAASGVDHKSAGLISALGLPPDTAWEFFAVSIDLAGPLLPQVSSVKNMAVPEAGSLLLLGSALGGFGIVVRRYWSDLPRN